MATRRSASSSVILTGLVLLLTAAAAPARAQSSRSSPDAQLARLKETATTELWVYQNDEPIHGFLTRLTEHEITLLDENQQEETIPLASVRRIERSGDRLWNGMAIGAAVGVAEYVLLLALETPSRASFAELSVGFGYAVGIPMLVGAGIDALHVGRTTIYDTAARTHTLALAPTRDGRGARLSWTIRF